MEQTATFISTLNYYLAFGTLLGTIVLVIWIVLLCKSIFDKKTFPFASLLSAYVLPLGFLITTAGMLMSLYYSEFLGVIPCVLCWYQRIFMYSQVFLFGYAWYKKDKNILSYSLVLSLVGFAIGMYHHLLQIGYDIYKPCSTSPFAVDCAKPTFVEFGFVTFPFMAVVLFGALILLVVTVSRFEKRA